MLSLNTRYVQRLYGNKASIRKSGSEGHVWLESMGIWGKYERNIYLEEGVTRFFGRSMALTTSCTSYIHFFLFTLRNKFQSINLIKRNTLHFPPHPCCHVIQLLLMRCKHKSLIGDIGKYFKKWADYARQVFFSCALGFCTLFLCRKSPWCLELQVLSCDREGMYIQEPVLRSTEWNKRSAYTGKFWASAIVLMGPFWTLSCGRKTLLAKWDLLRSFERWCAHFFTCSWTHSQNGTEVLRS